MRSSGSTTETKGRGNREEGIGKREKGKVMNVLLLVVALAVPVEAPKAALPEAAAASAAVAPATDVREVPAVRAAVVPSVDVREAVSVSGCSLLELPPVKRFLSAPWCAARRLRAARLRGDAEIAALKAKLLGGEIPFDGTLQNKLCVALGVEGYNAFVREYNGGEGKRE